MGNWIISPRYQTKRGFLEDSSLLPLSWWRDCLSCLFLLETHVCGCSHLSENAKLNPEWDLWPMNWNELYPLSISFCMLTPLLKVFNIVLASQNQLRLWTGRVHESSWAFASGRSIYGTSATPIRSMISDEHCWARLVLASAVWQNGLWELSGLQLQMW